MPLSGKGMLITLMDVDPAEETDFNRWYDKEHLAERVAIKGFTEARRYVAVGATPKGLNKYLNLYTTLAFEDLYSPEYKKVLASQTAWSLHHIGKFINPVRAIVRIALSQGQGRGSFVFFARLRPAAGREGALRAALEKSFPALVDQNGIISAHMVESDPELSRPLTDDPTPPPGSGDWFVFIDGTDAQSVTNFGEKLIGDANIVSPDERIAQGSYQLIWDLSKAELNS